MTWVGNALRGLVLALAFIGAFATTEVVLDREPPIKFENAVSLTPEVQQGGVLEVRYTIVRSRQCVATTTRFITDSAGTIHVPSTYTVGLRALVDGSSVEGRETYTRSVTIPLAAVTGPASYDVRFSYTCNFIHKLAFPIKVEAPTVRFAIIAAPPPLIPLTPD